MLSSFADHNRPKPAAPARTHLFTLALLGAVLLTLNPNADGQRPSPPTGRQQPAPPAPPLVITGSWQGNDPDPNGGPGNIVYVSILAGATPGTYTIRGQEAGHNWGSAPLILGQKTQSGLSASAELHGFYPTLDVQLEFSWASQNQVVVKLRSHWVDNGVPQSSDFTPLTLRRGLNQ